MTPKQTTQFNVMRAALQRIATKYQTPTQLRKSAETSYGLDAGEAIEYSYDNIQHEARNAVKGVREIKNKPGT